MGMVLAFTRLLTLLLLAVVVAGATVAQDDSDHSDLNAVNLFQVLAGDTAAVIRKGDNSKQGNSGESGDKKRDESIVKAKKGQGTRGKSGDGGGLNDKDWDKDNDDSGESRKKDPKREKGRKKKSRGANNDDDTSDDDDSNIFQRDPTLRPMVGPAPRPTASSSTTTRPATRPTPAPIRTTATPVVKGTTGSPVQPQSAEPTLVVNDDIDLRSCTPTIGPCIETFDNLTAAVSRLEPQSTVAICSNSTIRTSAAVSIASNGAKLCCAGSNCVIRSMNNTDRNLLVTGSTFTLMDVALEGGSSNVSGGNMAIFGSGNHRLIDSTFSGGSSRIRGGNVFIRTLGNVLVNGSAFTDGTAEVGGGGLAIESAAGVIILGSRFTGNEAPEGGGLYMTRSNADLPGQLIMIDYSSFIKNKGTVGGGFLVSNMGDFPSLTVMNNEFTENRVDTVGGAAAIVEFLSDMDFKYSLNNGTENSAILYCSGVVTAPSVTFKSPLCLNPDDTYPK